MFPIKACLCNIVMTLVMVVGVSRKAKTFFFFDVSFFIFVLVNYGKIIFLIVMLQHISFFSFFLGNQQNGGLLCPYLDFFVVYYKIFSF